MDARFLRTPLSVFSCVYAVAAVLFFAFPAPLLLFSPVFSSGAASAFVLGACCLLAAVFFFVGFREVAVPRTAWVAAGVPLAAAAVLSAVLSAASVAGWWGAGFETGTAGLYILFCLSIGAGALMLRRAVPLLMGLFVWSAAATVGIASFSYWLWPFFFESAAVSGSWPWVALVSAAGFLAVVAGWQNSRSGIQKYALFALAALFAGGLLLFSHPAQILALFCALLFYFFLLLGKRGHERAFAPVPVSALFVVLALVVFGPRAPLVPVPPEVRPSIELTLLVTGYSYSDSLTHILAGTGPKTFAAVWEKDRPVELNQSMFGSAEFDAGHNTAVTLFILLGVFGLAGLLFVAAGPLVLAFRYLNTALPEESEEPALVFLTLSCFCFVTLFFATPGPASLLAGGVFFGIAVRLLSGAELSVRIGRGLARGFILALPLALCGAALVWVSAEQIAAATLHTRGAALLAEGQAAQAAAPLVRAADLWPLQQYERDAARAALESVFAGLAERPETEPLKEEEFHLLTQKARELSDRSVSKELLEWRSGLACASLYLSLYTAAGPTYASQYRGQVEDCLEQAAHAAPSRSDVPYARARAAIVFNEQDAARAYVAEALQLKPDYAPALELQEVLGQ